MTFSTISVIFFLIYFLRCHERLSNYIGQLRYKYKAQTWHYGVFADAKLKRLLNSEDKLELKQRSKKVNLLFLYFLLYTLLIFMISGVFFNGKL